MAKTNENADLQSLQIACTTALTKYNKVVVRGCEYLRKLTGPMTFQQQIYVIKWRKQETSTRDAYIRALETLIAHLSSMQSA